MDAAVGELRDDTVIVAGRMSPPSGYLCVQHLKEQIEARTEIEDRIVRLDPGEVYHQAPAGRRGRR